MGKWVMYMKYELLIPYTTRNQDIQYHPIVL